jgi:hypothetical protein
MVQLNIRSASIIIMISTLFGNKTAIAKTDTIWYSGGKESLTLNNPPKETKGFLPVKGKSKYKNLMFEVKIKGKSKTFMLQTGKSGEFAGKYILTQGKGQYTVTIFGSNSFAGNFAGLVQFKFKNSQVLPSDSPKLFINDKIMAYVKTTIGKKVGRGECWDVAQMALDLTGADWQRTKGYGTKYNWKKNKAIPGDIIQFTQFSIRKEFENGYSIESYGAPDHTAIVWEVLGPGKYKIAHQNVGGVRKMMVQELDLNGKTSGRIEFFRPRAGILDKIP